MMKCFEFNESEVDVIKRAMYSYSDLLNKIAGEMKNKEHRNIVLEYKLVVDRITQQFKSVRK